MKGKWCRGCWKAKNVEVSISFKSECGCRSNLSPNIFTGDDKMMIVSSSGRRGSYRNESDSDEENDSD